MLGSIDELQHDNTTCVRQAQFLKLVIITSMWSPIARRKAILATFAFLALISFCGGLLFDIHLSQNSPTEPRPEEGKTYHVVANKVGVYLTRQQLIAFYIPGCSFFVWFGALAYFGVRWRIMQVPVRQPKFKVPKATKKKSNDA